MTPLHLKATLLGAAAFALLVPTFNALNAAHFEEVDPPFNLDPPENPPDIDDPPVGDQDIDLQGVPPPGSAGGCQEFETVDNPEYWSRPFQAQPSAQGLISGGGQGAAEEIEIGPTIVGLVLSWGVENYVGQFTVALKTPAGKTIDSGTAPSAGEAGASNARDEYPVAAPMAGTWIVDWNSEQEVSGGGLLVLSVREAKCKTPEAPAQ